MRRTDPLTSLPSGYPLPLLQYFVRDFSIIWHLYGGKDFGNEKKTAMFCSPVRFPCHFLVFVDLPGEVTEQKPYSRMSEAQHTPKLRQRFNEAKRNIYACGGPNRDHSVHAELYLNKVSAVFIRF